MFAHQAAKYNRWFPQGDWLVDIGLTHLSSNSRMGYFLWLNERIDTINTAKVTANINASNTVTGTTGPHDVGHAGVSERFGELRLLFF